MICFAPREVYEFEATVMELICASPCLTSLIRFSLEAKYRCGNQFDELAHMARHRMGARGNVTSFPMPCESMLLESQRTEAPAPAADLPWVGSQLADKVAILLKTNEDADGAQYQPKLTSQLPEMTGSLSAPASSLSMISM